MPSRTHMVITPAMEELSARAAKWSAGLPPAALERYGLIAKRRPVRAAVFACYDAANPDNPFGLEIGQNGWHRNAGGIVAHHEYARLPDHVDGAAATIQMAVAQSDLEAIGVIGHQDCAFCKAFLTQQYGPDQECLQAWVERHGPAIRELMLSVYGPPPDPKDTESWHTYLWHAVCEHTSRQYFNLLSYPSVIRRIEEGTLTAFAAVLQLTPTPQYLWFDPTTGRFKPVLADNTVGFESATAA